ncbi:MAG: FAD-binding domain-containing protein [Sedimentitalea sp.]
MTRIVFEPTRTAALTRLAQFLPHAGADYARLRNFDVPGHPHVSALSPYLRHRVITEADVLEATLARHSPRAAEKFVQEVIWRTYWKGWLENHPHVWHAYQQSLRQEWDNVQTQDGLRQAWQAACTGDTGIACFDHWAQELVQTGYLHNHARMWFASIWIFTLRLPWVLGADFFLRHLLDGDPASNTLGWRWVAGLHTKGKTYLARPDNIAKYTQGRFDPRGQLAQTAPPLSEPDFKATARAERPAPHIKGTRVGLILTPNDLSPAPLLAACPMPAATALFSARDRSSPLKMAPDVCAFEDGLMQDTAQRWGERLGPIDTSGNITDWANHHELDQVLLYHQTVGPEAEAIATLFKTQFPQIDIAWLTRPYDRAAWPHANRGFFKFKSCLPQLLDTIIA